MKTVLAHVVLYDRGMGNKTKKANGKKLLLSRETVRKLTSDELARVMGGNQTDSGSGGGGGGSGDCNSSRISASCNGYC